jgi:hypothetical protein
MRIKREVGKIMIGDACIFCGKWHDTMTRIKTSNKHWSMHICRYCKKKLMEFWSREEEK